MSEHHDVLIVGAGISGIGAACHLQDKLPGLSYAILEGREAIGGTWDLFRYPGIRSDSDMHTLGYRFRPWTAAEAIADGPAILDYVLDTAREYGVDQRIRFGHRVVAAEWSSADARWTVEVERGEEGDRATLTCDFLLACCGYFRYERGYLPEFEGLDHYRGELVHPQHWPEDLDYAGKRVAVIGSGATAVTLVPAMAADAAHVTMVQRSPTYVISMPRTDVISNFLRRVLPDRVAYSVTRWKNVLLQAGFYQLARRRPELVRRLLRRGNERRLPPGYDVDLHFNPRYNPWDQRVCLAPDADLFRAISDGSASIVTDEIETFTAGGLRLRSGAELEADVIVAATGLDLVPFGGIELRVDGERVELPQTLGYKGMMLRGVPNFIYAIGYTNASWTLKVDITCEYACRLLGYMREHGHRQAVPLIVDPSVEEQPFLDFSSGYVQRAIHLFPKRGSKPPWSLPMNYALDIRRVRYGPIDDGAMVFSSPDPAATTDDELAVTA